MHQNKGKTVAQCLKARTDYAKNGEKTENEELISSYACDKETVDQEFLLAKQEYLRITGRKQKGDIIAYQIRQSFKPGEITPEEANAVGYETAMRFTKGNHAFIVATHTDKAHIHNHIIFNSTNLNCDRKFRDSWFIALVLQKVSDIVCLEHALSVIKPRRPSERDNRNSYHRVSLRKELREHIDTILQEDTKNLNEFLKRLQESGYEIKNGKHISVRGKGQKRFIRLSSLGEGYTEEDIRKRILREDEICSEEYGKEAEKNQRKQQKIKQSSRGFDLLIDINKKMQEGKGRGYERWAKIYNVKQITKALLFLQEHGIRDYEELEKKTAETSERFDAVSKLIKEKEDKLHDIAALKMNIINFAKTKKIYDEYRDLRYDKDFFEAHREEITLYRASKEAFNRYKGKKLPKVRELSEQYREVLEEKRKLYSEYKEARKEMMDIKIAKQDIDRFLKTEEKQHQIDKNIAQEHVR
ncbi:relaxase/mobilization nuclease domain-containing protein [Oribacterium sp. WCC10]|uniref:relaxase/mobilization nuclease domain-containing protein n=1 Tax=Oribacterium sp. WCC10 TaxID=1855343 RepID=UPI0008E42A0B|nr:relaxase/mobilization nuclease domain-containing protein [Oribacterium sp. WCC10]SFG75705.1 Relaxase/Mobilisation nuclease domain-containing protein [Oribacterium sp. WCC10]